VNISTDSGTLFVGTINNGAVNINASDTGGNIVLTASAPSVGAGGSITLASGNGGTTSGASGSFTVESGTGGGSGNSGSVSFQTGSCSGNIGGSVTIDVGTASFAGGQNPGNVKLGVTSKAVNIGGGTQSHTNTAGATFAIVGVKGNTNNTGGLVEILSGPGATAGNVNIDTGTITSGTTGSITIGGTNATGITVGTTVPVPAYIPGGFSIDGITTVDSFYEANFTATISFGGSSTGVTYTSQAGWTERIGNRCFATYRIVLSSKGTSTGAVTMDGPAFGTNTASFFHNGYAVLENATLPGIPIVTFNTNNLHWNLMYMSSAGALTAFTDAQLTNTSTIQWTLMYLVS